MTKAEYKKKWHCWCLIPAEEKERDADLDELLRGTAEKAYSEMPGWRFKNFDEYWKSVTSPNTGDKK